MRKCKRRTLNINRALPRYTVAVILTSDFQLQLNVVTLNMLTKIENLFEQKSVKKVVFCFLSTEQSKVVFCLKCSLGFAKEGPSVFNCEAGRSYFWELCNENFRKWNYRLRYLLRYFFIKAEGSEGLPFFCLAFTGGYLSSGFSG